MGAVVLSLLAKIRPLLQASVQRPFESNNLDKGCLGEVSSRSRSKNAVRRPNRRGEFARTPIDIDRDGFGLIDLHGRMDVLKVTGRMVAVSFGSAKLICGVSKEKTTDRRDELITPILSSKTAIIA